MVPKGRRGSKTQRHGGRVVLSLDVEPRVRDALRERAALAGVSMAEYVSVGLAQPSRIFATTSVEIAQPLAQLSYRISRAQQAAATGDHQTVAAELELARRTVAEAMRPLAAPHAKEIRSDDRRRAGGWSG
jgi:N-acyl-L-homoserine lactone synthetase